MVRDNLRRAFRPLSPEAVLVLGFPGMLIKTRDTLASVNLALCRLYFGVVGGGGGDGGVLLLSLAMLAMRMIVFVLFCLL